MDIVKHTKNNVKNNLSIWETEISLNKLKFSLKPPRRVDVAIIGAGFTGLSAALNLLKNGYSVSIFEQKELGEGASSKSAGIISSEVTAPLDQFEKNYGDEIVEHIKLFYNNAYSHTKELIKAYKIDCDLKINGILRITTTHSEYETLLQQVKSQQGTNDNIFIDHKHIHHELDRNKFYGAILNPSGASLHPGKLLKSLALLVNNNGGTILLNCPVMNYTENKNNLVTINFKNGSTIASKLILATNAYNHLKNPLNKKHTTIGSSIISTAPLDHQTIKHLTKLNRCCIIHSKLMNYYRLTEDNRLIFGGRNNFLPENNIEKIKSSLLHSLSFYFPELANVKITHCWTGNISSSYDQLPHLGKYKNVYSSLGYSGRGIASAIYCGSLLSGYIKDNKQDYSFFTIKRKNFPWILRNNNFLSSIYVYIQKFICFIKRNTI